MNSKSSLIRRLFYQYYSDLFYRTYIEIQFFMALILWFFHGNTYATIPPYNPFHPK